MPRRAAHTPAWVAFTVLSFLLAIGMTALGIILLPLGLWERGFMAMATVFLVHASISLAKTLRDRHEAGHEAGQGAR